MVLLIGRRAPTSQTLSVVELPMEEVPHVASMLSKLVPKVVRGRVTDDTRARFQGPDRSVQGS